MTKKMTLNQELHTEQNYLQTARTHLTRMREKAENLELVAADAVSADYLASTMWAHIQRLQDDGLSALIFGRINVAGTHPAATDGPTSWRIGRRHVNDEAGQPLVLDWRAEVSTAFYRASPSEPMHVESRRRYGYDNGHISAFEDEDLTTEAPRGGPSAILAAEIERPRVGPMRDIVATIQPDQDKLVRVNQDATVCIQGAPGTGKTAVGLHRAAWLLFTHRERLAKSGVLVVGPNRAFLDHISAVLPTLGELDVQHTTATALVTESTGAEIRGVDPVVTATLKGDPRMAELLHRAVWRSVQRATEPLKVQRGARLWRIGDYEVRDVVRELRERSLTYEAARLLLPRRLAGRVLERINAAGDYPDGHVQDQIAKMPAIKKYCKTLWPQLSPAQVLFNVLSDTTVLADCAQGLFSDDEQRSIAWTAPPKTLRGARWSAADLVLLDELHAIMERTTSFGHIIVDEAQDLSAMQLRALGRRCELGSATVLGDIAQGTTSWATTSWTEALTHLGKPDGSITELTQGFRVPAAVIEYAAALLPHMAPGLTPPTSVRSNRGELTLAHRDQPLAATAEMTMARAQQPGSVGVIVADDQAQAMSAALTKLGQTHGVLGADHPDVDHQVVVVPATVAKGMEFDAVFVVEPAAIAQAEPDPRSGLRRLYVVLTRAVSALTVVHREPLPPQLQQ